MVKSDATTNVVCRHITLQVFAHERLAHLIGATAEAAAAAIVVVDRLNADALNRAIPESTKLDDWEGPR